MLCDWYKEYQMKYYFLGYTKGKLVGRKVAYSLKICSGISSCLNALLYNLNSVIHLLYTIFSNSKIQYLLWGLDPELLGHFKIILLRPQYWYQY